MTEGRALRRDDRLTGWLRLHWAPPSHKPSQPGSDGLGGGAHRSGNPSSQNFPVPRRIYSDLSKALENEAPSFAVIANPTGLHIDAALACTNAGCDLLIEKPISHSLEGVDELEAAATALGTKILVGFQFRFHPALMRIRDLLRSGAMGAPLHARVIWAEHLPSWHPWEDWRKSYAARAELGGGVHHTICHPFDYLRMIFGDPVTLFATLTRRRPAGIVRAGSGRCHALLF